MEQRLPIKTREKESGITFKFKLDFIPISHLCAIDVNFI